MRPFCLRLHPGVALFPAAQESGACDVLHISSLTMVSSTPRTSSVLSMPLVLRFCLLHWRTFDLPVHRDESWPEAGYDRRKHVEHHVLICGWIIVACIVGILTLHIGMHMNTWGPIPVCYFPLVAAVVAFGVSWLVKGELSAEDKSGQRSNAEPRKISFSPYLAKMSRGVYASDKGPSNWRR